jgi:uncharacterized protein (DUF1697 family)
MPVVISLLRGVNVVGRNMVKMEDLRGLCVSLGFSNPQTHLQSGNVVFRTKERNLTKLAKCIEDGLERKFGFRPQVVLRTAPELKSVLARNPFARRRGINGSKLLITFLSETPAAETRDAILNLKPIREEIRIDGRELYVYFRDGMGQSKLWHAFGRALKNSGTGRNLNTVTKLLAMAEKLGS